MRIFMAIEFNAHQLYIKEMTVLSPLMPQALAFEWDPDINFEIDVSYNEMADSLYEVILKYKLKVELDNKGKKVEACALHIQQAGLFVLKNANEEEKKYLLLIKAPEILYPFVCEMVSSSVNRLGFPQIVLPLVNFES